MAAPTADARGTPGGLKLRNGYQSLVTFEDNPTVKLFEKSVQPPGLEGGEPIPQTTMHNVTWHTQDSQDLITLTPITFTCAYDPAVYDQVLLLVNNVQVITITFSDGSTVAIYGWLKSFTPNEMSPGVQPDAVCVIVPSNFDPADQSEQGPVVVEVAGT